MHFSEAVTLNEKNTIFFKIMFKKLSPKLKMNPTNEIVTTRQASHVSLFECRFLTFHSYNFNGKTSADRQFHCLEVQKIERLKSISNCLRNAFKITHFCQSFAFIPIGLCNMYGG